MAIERLEMTRMCPLFSSSSGSEIATIEALPERMNSMSIF
jgi:hypothetical protein